MHNQRPETPSSITRRSMRLFFTIFMVTGALISGAMVTFYHSEVNSRLGTLINQEEFSIKLQSKVVNNVIDSIVADLFFLRQQNELQEYLTTGDSLFLRKLGKEYVAFSEQKKVYDQIRYLDKNGMEIVRVNHNHGFPEILSTSQLQSKKKRYYFKDCFNLAKNEVFISPFDLNIERGKIEQPLKPMIRLGTPVFDSDNQKQGIVLVNYLGNDLITKILESESLSIGKTMLLNSTGYWLQSSDPEQEWGFMFQDQKRRFSVLYPRIWNGMLQVENGQIHDTEGLFTFMTIYPLREGYYSSTGSGEAYRESAAKISHNAYKWYLVSHVPTHVIQSYSQKLLMKFFLFGAGIFLLVATGSWIISYTITKRRMYQAQLQSMALFDPLTELPNRRLFFDRLEMIIEHSQRYKTMFGLLYVDLDGFKAVNDTYGHKAGDELLQIVARRLVKVCRKSDTVARLGGDEFAVIIDMIETTRDVETVAQKIIASVGEPIELENGSVQVGASIGVSIFPNDSRKAGELVQLADTAMYESKGKGKNTYTIVTPEAFDWVISK